MISPHHSHPTMGFLGFYGDPRMLMCYFETRVYCVMYKILITLLFLCLVSGCTVVVPLYAQLKNMEPSRVCPMPMPACKMLFEWDDDMGNIPKQPIDSARSDDQITGGDIAMAVCGFPIYCYFVVPAIISDVFFFPI